MRKCKICKSESPTERLDWLEASGRPTGVTYYFCNECVNVVDDFITDKADEYAREHEDDDDNET